MRHACDGSPPRTSQLHIHSTSTRRWYLNPNLNVNNHQQFHRVDTWPNPVMGQALTKHHWHGADRFLVEAHLHVPEHQNSPQYRRQQKQPAREPTTPRPDTPPRSLDSSPEQNPKSTDIESSATSDAGSSLPSSSSSDGDHLLTFTSLPPEEARAIAATNWISVLDQAASFKHVYHTSLTAWISLQQASTTSSAAASAPQRPPHQQHPHSRSTSSASSAASKPSNSATNPPKIGRAHV